MSGERHCCALFFLLALIPARSVLAVTVNQLQNGDFQSGIASWTPDRPAGVSWSSSGYAGDSFGTGAGGSLHLSENRELFNAFTQVSQCVNTSFPNGWLFLAEARFFQQIAGYTDGKDHPTASAGIDAEAILQFFPSVNCAGSLISEQRFGVSPTVNLEQGNTHWVKVRGFGGVGDLETAAKSVRVYLAVVKRLPDESAEAYFDSVFLGDPNSSPAPVPCFYQAGFGGNSSLCLNRGRFRVGATWKTGSGTSGTAKAIQFGPDTGQLWFFDSSNSEVIVKVIDACSFNSRYWVYAGGLTDVEVTMTVTDTKTGAFKVYKNPLGAAFQPIQDSSAFATCP